MKRPIILGLIFWVLVLVMPAWCRGEEKPLSVAVGLRSTYFRMEHSKGQILRNLISFEEDQNYLPYKFMVQADLLKYLALEFGYEKFKATSLNRGLVRAHSDGDLEWSPIMLGLQFRWPHFHKSFVPYLLGGVSYNLVSFSEPGWYYYGFPSPEAYESWLGQGNKPEDYPNNGYRRRISPENVWGTFLGLGMDFFLSKNWALNLDWRYHWVQSNFTFSLGYSGGEEVASMEKGTFNLNTWVIGLGVKYFF